MKKAGIIVLVICALLVLPILYYDTGAIGLQLLLTSPFLLLGIWLISTGKKEEVAAKKWKDETDAFQDKINREWKEISTNFDVDHADCLQLKILDGFTHSPFMLLMVLKNDILSLIPARINSVQAYRGYGFNEVFRYDIPISQIRYYLQSGETLTNVTGSGGGSGYSMISGWNGKVNPISIKTNIIDKKLTALYYEKDGNDCLLTFEHENFHIFKKIIPEKDYAVVQNLLIESQKDKTIDKPTDSDKMAEEYSPEKVQASYTDQLRSLKQLADEGILTEEEYAQKKKAILDRI